MTLNDVFNGMIFDQSTKGAVVADRLMLAFNPDKKGTKTIKEFLVFSNGITNMSPTNEAQTNENTYYYTGTNTTKTGTNYTITISGDRFDDDDAQNTLADLNNIFATGSDVVYEAVVFDKKTGKGHICTFTVEVSQSSGGDAGGNAPFEATFSKIGMNPVAFDYETDKDKTFNDIVTGSI